MVHIVSGKKKLLLGLGMVAVAGLAISRVGCGQQGAGVEPRDAVRVFACRSCAALTLATPEAIKQQYLDERTRPGPGGVLFACPSCQEVEANVVSIDLQSVSLACPSCGWEGPRTVAGIQKMIEQERARASKKGEVEFLCPECEDFTARLTSLAQTEEK